MKKIFPILSFLFLAVLFSSCKNSNSPQAVTEKFLTSFSKMDYATAKTLSTQNTWAMLDILASFTKEMPESEKNALFQNFKVKVTDTPTRSRQGRHRGGRGGRRCSPGDHGRHIGGLRPAFEGRHHHRGNASQITDGAAALVLKERRRPRRRGAKGSRDPRHGSSPTWDNPPHSQPSNAIRRR